MWGRNPRRNMTDVNVYTARRLDDMAQSLGLLAKNCEDEIDHGLAREDALAAMQVSAATVCGSCSRCNLYRDSEKEESYYPYYLLRAFEQKGQVEFADMPRFFLETCGRREEYLAQLNRNLGRAAMNLEWKNRFLESRDAVMVQFRELARILEEFAQQLESASDITALCGRAVRRVFQMHHIAVDNLLLMEYRGRYREAWLTMHTTNGRCVTTREAAQMLGRAMGGKRWYAPRDTRTLITRRPSAIRFLEKESYQMMAGVAWKAKNGETISGDNYMYSDDVPGEVILSLSDGMGSGKQAATESRRVVELAQQLLETGFSARSSFKMINTILLLTSKQQRPATLDVACVDLHTGVLEAMKLGAMGTFIVGEGGVETLAAPEVPAGVLEDVEPALLSRKLWDDERIVMITDGILEACPGEDKEKNLREYLEYLGPQSPQEMAERILDFAAGEMTRDDMTVVVAGIWKRKD